jgi:hypothetical protein
VESTSSFRISVSERIVFLLSFLSFFGFFFFASRPRGSSYLISWFDAGMRWRSSVSVQFLIVVEREGVAQTFPAVVE